MRSNQFTLLPIRVYLDLEEWPDVNIFSFYQDETSEVQLWFDFLSLTREGFLLPCQYIPTDNGQGWDLRLCA